MDLNLVAPRPESPSQQPFRGHDNLDQEHQNSHPLRSAAHQRVALHRKWPCSNFLHPVTGRRETLHSLPKHWHGQVPARGQPIPGHCQWHPLRGTSPLSPLSTQGLCLIWGLTSFPPVVALLTLQVVLASLRSANARGADASCHRDMPLTRVSLGPLGRNS